MNLINDGTEQCAAGANVLMNMALDIHFDAIAKTYQWAEHSLVQNHRFIFGEKERQRLLRDIIAYYRLSHSYCKENPFGITIERAGGVDRAWATIMNHLSIDPDGEIDQEALPRVLSYIEAHCDEIDDYIRRVTHGFD